MSIDTRLEKLARILRKAAPSYGPDDYNPDDDESAFTPEFEVEDESASDLEETPDIEDGGLRPGMTTEERIKRIKERNEALEEDRLLNPMPVEKELSPAEEKAAREKFYEDQRSQVVDMNVPAGPGIQDVINKRRNELEEAITTGDEAAIASAQKALDSAEDVQRSIEEETWTPPARLNEDGTEYVKPAEPAPYDRSADQAKNEEALRESEEIQQELDDEDDKLAKNVNREFDIKMDDVLVLADTMYSKEQAKEDLNDMDIKELYQRVLDKYNKLNPSAPTDEGPEEKAARALGRYLMAAEEEDEEKEEDLYKEYKGMSDLEKIEAADYVQLYALDKLFTKQLKAKEKPEAKGEDDDEVDYETIERNLNEALGRKPKDESLHGEGFSIGDEKIKKYQKELDEKEAKEKAEKEAKEKAERDAEEAKASEKARWEEERAASVRNKFVKARGLFEDKVCSACGEASDCQCPGGPKIASVTNKYRKAGATELRGYIPQESLSTFDNIISEYENADNFLGYRAFTTGIKSFLNKSKENEKLTIGQLIYLRNVIENTGSENDWVEKIFYTASVTNKPFSVREADVMDPLGYMTGTPEGEFKEGDHVIGKDDVVRDHIDILVVDRVNSDGTLNLVGMQGNGDWKNVSPDKVKPADER